MGSPATRLTSAARSKAASHSPTYLQISADGRYVAAVTVDPSHQRGHPACRILARAVESGQLVFNKIEHRELNRSAFIRDGQLLAAFCIAAQVGRFLRRLRIGWIDALLSSHLSGHHPIERDSHKTDGVLGTKIVRHKTGENLGRIGDLRHHSVVELNRSAVGSAEVSLSRAT